MDLHFHSRFSRACSANLNLMTIEATCRRKGLDIVGTADFTHPEWFKEIEENLVEVGRSGFYQLASNPESPIRFMLSSEVALIYKQNDKTRKIHLVIHAPNLEAVRQLNQTLTKRGFNIRSDGRPILGLSTPAFVKICRQISPDFIIYPAHIWTPWFSVFGSKSGFDRLEECFLDQTEFIDAYETGLSSDPEMNWRVSQLDNLILLSNSDAHSLANLAREATIMDLAEISYKAFQDILRNRRKDKVIATLEFFPEEGMYHLDGHRQCSFVCEPKETKKINGLCPKCHRPLTIGVFSRVEELADRPAGYRPQGAADFEKLVELDKIIAESLNLKSRTSKKVQAIYEEMLATWGSELEILRRATIEELAKNFGPMIAEGIRRVRMGEVSLNPGFDGQYGRVSIFTKKEKS
ncbi:MAG TPA: endonuclease Q family protein [bacterium]|nr:endonuclease Q family protein [bacterium]